MSGTPEWLLVRWIYQLSYGDPDDEGRLGSAINYGRVVLAHPRSLNQRSPECIGGQAWTGEPKWICSSSCVGSMNLVSAR